MIFYEKDLLKILALHIILGNYILRIVENVTSFIAY